MAAVLNITIGSAVLFLFLAFMLGGVGNAINFFVLAAICTAGIGLAMWAGLAWVIGWVVMAVVHSLRGQSPASV